jgi:hypothetical protein
VYEQSLATFMENFGFKSRKVAMHQQKTRDAAAKSFEKLGLSATVAKQMADKALTDNITKGTVKLEDN